MHTKLYTISHRCDATQSFRCPAATHTATTNKKEDCSER